MSASPTDWAKAIKARQRVIDRVNKEIDDIAKQNIDDFHWLDHRVSRFWDCEKSPIGMCVFNLNDHGREVDCRYCGGPVERK